MHAGGGIGGGGGNGSGGGAWVWLLQVLHVTGHIPWIRLSYKAWLWQ